MRLLICFACLPVIAFALLTEPEHEPAIRTFARFGIALCAFLVPFFAVFFYRPPASDEAALPINPLADARLGDWAAYVATVTCEPLGIRDKALLLHEITSIEDNKVTLVKTRRSSEGEVVREQTFLRTMAPRVRAFFELKGKRITDLRVSADQRVVGRTAFSCTQLSFETDKRGEHSSTRAWLSPEVRAPGIVSMIVKSEKAGPNGSVPVLLKATLLGYGTSERTLWGQDRAALATAGASDLDSATGETESPKSLDVPDLPFNPFPKARVGDWSRYSGTLKEDGKPDRPVNLSFRVSAIEGDRVTLMKARDGLQETSEDHAKEAPPTIGTFFDLRDKRITSVFEEEGECVVAGREFVCTRVACRAGRVGETVIASVWSTPDMTVPGIVSMSLRIQRTTSSGPSRSVLNLEVAGFGSSDGPLWGTRGETQTPS
jgi:hypothetical protein